MEETMNDKADASTVSHLLIRDAVSKEIILQKRATDVSVDTIDIPLRSQE